MRTKTGELSVKADTLRLLVKSLRPMPDKWPGLADVEQRYRQRYVDLIVSPDAREVFVKRSQVIGALRRWLDARRFLEGRPEEHTSELQALMRISYAVY